MDGFDGIVQQVFRAATGPLPANADLRSWWLAQQAAPAGFQAALAAGLAGGELAYCFAGGYQAALRQLWPSLDDDAFGAFLLSEGRRQRPDELLTTLTPLPDGRFRLDGEKSWVTGGAMASLLLVVARAGALPDGRVRSLLVALPAGTPGTHLEERPPIGVLAALPHGKARFEGVVVEPGMLAAGDGWVDYGKPFRTIEDIHVSTAVAAHLAAQALRAGWPEALAASLLGCLGRLAECAGRDVAAPLTHLLLAAAERELQFAAAQVNECVAAVDDAFARDWKANQAVLMLAVPARGQRLMRAVGGLRPRPA